MRISTVGNVLVIAGAFVGAAAIVAVATDFSPSLSPEMITLLFYKGLGAAAVGLMLVGTWIARSGRRIERPPEQPRVLTARPPGSEVGNSSPPGDSVIQVRLDREGVR